MAKTLPEEMGLERIGGKGLENEGLCIRTIFLLLGRVDKDAMLREAKRWRRIEEDNK
jgi:hypothetical protein